MKAHLRGWGQGEEKQPLEWSLWICYMEVKDGHSRKRTRWGCQNLYWGFVIWLFPMESNIGLLDANNKLYERVE